MGLMETVVFGFIALTCAIIGLVFLKANKPLLSSVTGIITVCFVVLSGWNWRLALIDSGKNVQWLGLDQYPFAVIILLVLAAAGFSCIIMGIVRSARLKST